MKIDLSNSHDSNPAKDKPADRTAAASVRLALWVTVIGFGVFFVWAVFVPISKGLLASGVVAVDGKRKTIQHLEGGIVAAIHVVEGQFVNRDELLLELDPTRNKAEFALLSTRFYTALATLDRFRAERANLTEIAFSPDIMRAKDDPRVKELIAVQRNLMTARQTQFTGQINILSNQISRLSEQLVGLRGQRDAIDRQVKLLGEEVERIEGLYGQSLTELSRVNQAKIQLAEAQGRLGNVEASIAAADVQIGEARLAMLQIENERQQEIAEGILQSQERSFEIEEQLTSVKSVLERTEIRAPQSGKVLGLAVATVGGVVSPGAALMGIVPVDDNLVIEARIRPADIAAVEEGMDARARFVAFNDRTAPEVSGVVSVVSADILYGEDGQQPFYTIRVDLPADRIDPEIAAEIVPGMPVELMVEAGKRTPMEYFLQPITDVIRRSMLQ